MAFLFVLKYVLSTCKTLFLESCTASTTMFSLLIPYLAPFFGIFHPGHQITGGNITYIHSTHISHAGRDATRDRCHDESAISTYTPHARRDFLFARTRTCGMISTHTPHAGRDTDKIDHAQNFENFYSHAPCGARLYVPNRIVWSHWNFYSHASCEARQARLSSMIGSGKISTHTPLARRDSYA